MGKLFHANNPVMVFLSAVGDLMLLNMLFLFSCIPVFTIGTALSAISKVTLDMAMGQDPSIMRTYARAFKENFKNATIAWLLMFAAWLLMGLSAMVLITYDMGSLFEVSKIILIAACLVMLVFESYLFPLLARYDNTIRGHLANICVLSLAKPFVTIFITAIHAIPLMLLNCSLSFISDTVIYWLLIGFSLLSYLSSIILRPVFKELEAKQKVKMS